MHHNNWNEGVGGLGTELNLLNTQVRENSLSTAQIVDAQTFSIILYGKWAGTHISCHHDMSLNNCSKL